MLVRRIARPLLATAFVANGVDTLRHPGRRVDGARRLGLPNPEQAVRYNAGVMVAAGLALGTSRLPRLSAAVLAGSLVPTTVARHPFWQEKDPATRSEEAAQFLKNAGLLGGLLLAAADLEGRESLPRRARRVRRAAAHSTRHATEAAGRVTEAAGRVTEKAAVGARSALHLAD